MKNILITSIAALGLSLTTASAAELTAFRICEDQRVIHTSDGAEAGRVEYIMVEPSSFRVVSAVVRGGVVAEKFVVLPISVMHFGTGNEITLTNITREKLVAAPVFEATHFHAGMSVDTSVIEPSYTHFGVNASEITRTSTDIRTERDVNRSSTTVEGNAAIERNPNQPDRNSGRGNIQGNDGERNRDAHTSAPNDPANSARNPAAIERDPNRADRTTTTPDHPATPDTAPGKNGNTPGQNDTAPGKSGNNPGQDDTAPGKSRSTPGRDDTAPGKNGNNPGQDETTPGKSRKTPGNDDTSPGKIGNTPGKTETAPGKSKRTEDASSEKTGTRSEKADKTESEKEDAAGTRKRSGKNEGEESGTPKSGKRPEKGASDNERQR